MASGLWNFRFSIYRTDSPLPSSPSPGKPVPKHFGIQILESSSSSGFWCDGERRVFKHSALWLLFQTVFLVVSRALYPPVSALSVIGKAGHVTC